MSRPIRPDESDTPSVTAAKLARLLKQPVEPADIERMREHLVEARQRIADAEVAKRPKCDQTCAKCSTPIPHGDPFVPVLRYIQRGYVADPHFIGRQPVSWGVEAQPIGALCLACVVVPRV